MIAICFRDTDRQIVGCAEWAGIQDGAAGACAAGPDRSSAEAAAVCAAAFGGGIGECSAIVCARRRLPRRVRGERPHSSPNRSGKKGRRSRRRETEIKSLRENGVSLSESAALPNKPASNRRKATTRSVHPHADGVVSQRDPILQPAVVGAVRGSIFAMRLLMGTSIVTEKTMVAAQRIAANRMSSPGPLDTGDARRPHRG